MPALLKRTLVSACVLIALALLLRSQVPAVSADAETLEAKDDLQWYRGNIHTHSLWSDGDDYPEMIARWYTQHGYQFLCFTDHNVLATVERWTDVEKNKGKRKAYDKLKEAFPQDWVEERMKNDRLEVRLKRFDELSAKFNDPGKFLLVQGEEITDKFQNLPVHLNASNVQELIPPMRGNSVADTIQNNVNAVIAQRERTGKPMMIHLNHPNFGYAVTAEDLMRIRGEKFFEVYNGHPGVHNSGSDVYASTERIWDIVLTKRIAELGLPVMYGLATDDGHNYHKIPSRASEPGRGWVMVLAKSLTAESLIDAMESGKFYASSGVALTSVTSSNEGLDVVVAAGEGVEYTIEFIGTQSGYDPEGRPVLGKDGKPMRATQKYSADIGRVLRTVKGTRASYRFTEKDIYVRARVTSSKRHPNPSELNEFERAWTQPVIGPGAPDNAKD